MKTKAQLLKEVMDEIDKNKDCFKNEIELEWLKTKLEKKFK